MAFIRTRKRIFGDDHVSRGLFYLIVWTLVAPIAFGAVGSLTLGLVGLIIGFVGAMTLGVWGYGKYLDWHLRRIVGSHGVH